ncbi:MAG: hypothetical protein D8M58_09235 [Calditrichaeota bacterium]|nr:MAG: hypothetical protein DWQ03_17255 [Calditrichota bacterium]MBL1205569.1 hypothetical protein [Calditrichota bacterium]NOG45398.1 hypothetical protein [Calditrichota bacterium]
MNKLRAMIGVLAVVSLFIGQCGCPYIGSNPAGALNSEGIYYLLHYWFWYGSDAKYEFSQNGEMEITPTDTKETKKGFWTTEGETVTFVLDGEVTVYTLEEISDSKIRLYNDETSFHLEKGEKK